jgi:hypothetical protein
MEPCEDGENFIRVSILRDDSPVCQARFDIVIRESRLLLGTTPLRCQAGFEKDLHHALEVLLLKENVITPTLYTGFWD